MSECIEAPSATGSSPSPRTLYPKGIAFLIEERPLLWYDVPTTTTTFGEKSSPNSHQREHLSASS